ncbi:hypothetical protein B566_EDAN013196 [Ephemera danica]|nr:hypothetical protein B566_EDAN013196 [Ephemera danica]
MRFFLSTESSEPGVGVERARGAAEQAVERLVQKLVSAVGEIDPRFASKFLVTFDSRGERSAQTEWPGKRFRYLVRIDALSWPTLYPEGTEGDEGVTHEIEAPSTAVEGDDAGALPNGWVRAAAGPPSENESDESRVCGSPGKVLDAGLLQNLLAEVLPQHQLFYGPSDAQRCRPPDPRDFQLAVLHEGGSGPVLLRVGLLSPALQAALPRTINDELGTGSIAPPVVEVRLHVGVSLGGWPRDPGAFPTRLPLHHPLALIAYKSAQHGYYAVAVGPPSAVRCEERRSAWQTRFPGTELELDGHFSASSTPRRVLATLRLLASQMEQPSDDTADAEGGLRIVRDVVLRSLVKRQLERYTSTDAWEPASLAAHVLLCLDALLASLRARHAPNFFVPDANLLLPTQGLGSAPTLPGPPQDQEEAWETAVADDALAVNICLSRLHAATRVTDETSSTLHSEWGAAGDEERRGAALEAALLARWRSALNTVSPTPSSPAAAESVLARLSGHSKRDAAPRPEHFAPRQLDYIAQVFGHSKRDAAPRPEHFAPRQLDYIAQVLRELVRFRRATLQHQACRGVDLLSDDEQPCEEGPMEDFLFLLQAVLEQALGASSPKSGQSLRRTASGNRRHKRQRKQYDRQQAWRAGLAEAIRRDQLPHGGELSLVRHLLLWLWRAAGSAPGPGQGQRLSRFLASAWASSREGAWHLPEWRRRHDEAAAELGALSAFCTMLLASQEGWTGVAVLRDAVDKGWRWARAAQAELARSGSLQLVLAPSPGVVRRCDVALALQPSSEMGLGPRSRARTLPASLRYRQPTISQDELTIRLGRGGTVTWHEITNGPSHLRLRDGSPLSAALDARRRYGQQHALGNLVHAFIAMHRISVLQEVAALLPHTERQPVLDALQRLSRARRLTKARRAAEQEEETVRRCNGVQQGRYTAYYAEFPSAAGEQQTPTLSVTTSSMSSEQKLVETGGILGSCRAARTLQRRHSLFNAFPGELDASLAALHGTSPASVRRRYGGAAAAAMIPMRGRPGIALLQLGDAGEITLRPELETPVQRPVGRLLTKF